MSASPSKIRKQNKQPKLKAEADNLSSLPDDILHRILATLDIKFIVSLSVLSKRWQFFWTSVPRLNFSFKRFPSTSDPNYFRYLSSKPQRPHNFEDSTTTAQYLDFEQRVLLARSTTTATSQYPLLKFSFTCETHHCCERRVYEYVRAAIRNGVQMIHLRLGLRGFEFEEVFRGGEYIRVLILHAFGDQHIEIPDHMGLFLPNLEYLHLETVGLCLGQDLFSAEFPHPSPFLKTLILRNCNFDCGPNIHGNRLLISSTSLRTLVLENKGYERCKITISTPNLSFLKFCDDPWRYEFVKDLISPVNVQFDVSVPKLVYPAYCARVISLIQLFEAVKDLSLGYQTIKVIRKAARVKVADISTSSKPLHICLPNVRSLKLEILPCKKCTHVIVYLLQNAPTIETLVLETLPVLAHSSEPIKGALWLKDNFAEAVMKTKLPQFSSKLDHLKKVKITNFLGCEEDFRLLRLLLKTASTLEAIILAVPEKYSPQHEYMKTTISRMLQRLPRASSSISISFSFNA